MATQCDLILMHMKKYGSITHMEAESEYGIARYKLAEAAE